MKIQCPCGTKYSFDVTPEMARQPIQFVCSTCGLDSTEAVNALIQREIAAMQSAEAPNEAQEAPPPPPPPSPPPPPTPIPHTGTARVRLQAVPKSPQPSTGETETIQVCAKHPGELTVHRCMVCKRPMCRKCMEIFGYVCSPYCANKAEAQGMDIPRFAGQKSVRERAQWRKIGFISGSITLVIAAFFTLWFWYAWFGSVPKPVFSVRFEEAVRSGKSVRAGQDQIIFLHGGLLARYDLKTQKEVWSRQLLDPKQIEREVATTLKEMRSTLAQLSAVNPDAADGFTIPRASELTEEITMAHAAALDLHVRDRMIWVASERNLIRYGWDDGKPTQELPLAFGSSGVLPRGNELLVLGIRPPTEYVVNHIDLGNGDSRLETFGASVDTLATAVGGKSRAGRTPDSKNSRNELAGLPTVPGEDADKPMDPAKVEAQVQNLPFPARVALPAILAGTRAQEQALRELNEDGTPRRTRELEPVGYLELIPSEFGYLQFSNKLLEAKFITRTAVREQAPSRPKKSVLDNPNVNASQSLELANELLGEWQRERGGHEVTEDVSRYLVSVRRPDVSSAAEWSSEVVGPPAFFPLKTVSVVTAGKSVIVLDKENKKLWQTELSYEIDGLSEAYNEDTAPYGHFPCVERNGILYTCDKAMLTAFELATGRVKWRIPSVGISGMFFDGEGKMYLNTTTASPDTIKYSREIDVTRRTDAVVQKIDPETGKTLWTAKPGAFIYYISGKYIYTLQSYQADDKPLRGPLAVETGMETPSYTRIKRLSPKNGRQMWEHYERRAALNVAFDENVIRLVFRKEVEVLRFFTL